MENTQNHGRSVGKVTTTFNGEKIQVEVFEDRSVILPDGTVRKVKQEVVDALLAKQQAAAPTPTPAPAPAANPVVIQMNRGTQRSAPIPVAPAGQFYKPPRRHPPSRLRLQSSLHPSPISISSLSRLLHPHLPQRSILSRILHRTSRSRTTPSSLARLSI